MDMVDVLNFLFQLGSMTLGRSYSLAPLTQTQATLLDDLKDFGIIYQRKVGSFLLPNVDVDIIVFFVFVFLVDHPILPHSACHLPDLWECGH